MEERLGGERSACSEPACLSAAGLKTLRASLWACWLPRVSWQPHLSQRLMQVEQRVKSTPWRGGPKNTMNWKQQHVINQVVKCVNEQGQKGEWTINERNCRYPNRFLRLNVSVRTLSIWWLGGHCEDYPLGTDKREAAYCWVYCSGLKRTTLSWSQTSGGVRLFLWKKSSMWHHHTETAQYSSSVPAAFSPLIALIDLFKELLTSADS